MVLVDIFLVFLIIWYNQSVDSHLKRFSAIFLTLSRLHFNPFCTRLGSSTGAVFSGEFCFYRLVQMLLVSAPAHKYPVDIFPDLGVRRNVQAPAWMGSHLKQRQIFHSNWTVSVLLHSPPFYWLHMHLQHLYIAQSEHGENVGGGKCVTFGADKPFLVLGEHSDYFLNDLISVSS